MLVRTPSSVGMSCALALNIAVPQIVAMYDIHPLVGAVSAAAAGSIGGNLSDVDSSRSKSHNSVKKISTAVLFVSILTVFLDQQFQIGIIDEIIQNSSYTRVTFGIVALLATCVYGSTTKHRTFMHSFSGGLVVTSICVFIIAPFLVPFYAIGYVSHILIDLPNHRKVYPLYPFVKKGICFSICKSDGTVNYTLETVASAIAAILLLYQFIMYKDILGIF